MSLAERIKKLRESRGLRVTELAKRSRISKAYLSQLESGHSSHPSAEVVIKICRALGCSIDTLLGIEQREPTMAIGSGLPRSLRSLAREESLSTDEIVMLSNISYKGRQPESVEGWRAILETIRHSIQ